MPTDPLRDRIAVRLSAWQSGVDASRASDPWFRMQPMSVRVSSAKEADAILAIVREHATSDAAVEAAARGTYASNRWNRRTKLGVFEPIPWEELAADEHATRIIEARAAITAALGGGDG